MNQWRNDEVLSYFVTEPENYIIKPLGEGLINQTFLIEHINSKAKERFILQCINHQVFKHPQNIVDNSLLISEHLTQLGDQYSLSIMMPKVNLSGDFLVFNNGKYWRGLSYIDNCISPQTIDDTKQAHQAAYTFSTFSRALAKLPVASLKPVIDKFHDLPDRLVQLSNAVSIADSSRLNEAQLLIHKFQSQTDFIDMVNDLIPNIPQRITHNDTKINNLLFDKLSLQPKAVIDLDTCMPGYLMHDFGDMVRSCCNSINDDDINLDSMEFKNDIFESLLTGYIAGFNNKIIQQERDSLLVGARLMPFTLGCRFLTDYLLGDIYFSADHQLHNLHRAANQFKLFELTTHYITTRNCK